MGSTPPTSYKSGVGAFISGSGQFLMGDADGKRTGFEELFIPQESGTIIPSEIINKQDGKIIVLTQKGDQVSVPVPVESESSGGGSSTPTSSFEKVAKYAQFTSLLTV